MTQALAEIVAAMPWLEVIKTVATVATAYIAFRALRNWQRQDRAKREVEFLDGLIDAAHQHIIEMQRPVELLRAAKIGMASHVQSWNAGDENDKITAGAIAYIKRRGEDDGKRLGDALTAIEHPVIKLRSLAVKGQMFNFKEYRKCQDAVTKLTWHFGRIRAFTSMIDNPSWNWENPQVSSLLAKVMVIDPDEIIQDLSSNNAIIISFARDTYSCIYGK
ncbi:hypothetical protein [Sphingopyxis sp.]|uniref:hypothetical protein n=1 Tax=Sphingopyxis sp. TaxID=1908224 RepID=UPI002B46E0E3|nr:hypothetical protein [Sphingopyxis sp.]HJS10005.1 hypothetical protein [Sphingopyxis sp.]